MMAPISMLPEYSYVTKFSLTSPVGDFNAAKRYLESDAMEKYVPEGLKNAVKRAKWILTSNNGGYIKITTRRLLEDCEREQLSEWISAQNSDGLGERFEQQDFAYLYGNNPYTKLVVDEWKDVVAAFDYETNSYRLELQINENDFDEEEIVEIETPVLPVHCKDCKYMYEFSGGGRCCRFWNYHNVEPNDFCSRAIKKN